MIRDLYSRSGTLVNGNKITPFEDRPLQEMDSIQVNDAVFIVQHVSKVESIKPLPAEPLTART